MYNLNTVNKTHGSLFFAHDPEVGGLSLLKRISPVASSSLHTRGKRYSFILLFADPVPLQEVLVVESGGRIGSPKISGGV